MPIMRNIFKTNIIQTKTNIGFISLIIIIILRKMNYTSKSIKNSFDIMQSRLLLFFCNFVYQNELDQD